MILTTTATCDLITVVSEDGYIDDIVTADGSECCHVLELGTNCCTPTLLLPIRSLYTFGAGVSACGLSADPLFPGFNFLDIGLLGLNIGCIESITYPAANGVGTITDTNPTSASFIYNFNQLPVGGIIPFQVIINTCTGLDYTLDFTITVNTPGDPCISPLVSGITTTYPTLPTGVTINVSNEFEIDPTALGLSTIFPDGIYFVGISQTNVLGQVAAESNSIFVNCDSTCRVIDILAKDTCSKIYLLLDALRYADNCNTIAYQQKCDIWFVVAKELGYFTNNPCGDVEDCGCN